MDVLTTWSAAVTCKPALGVPVLSPLQPGLVPGVGEVHQENELDDDEAERAHGAKVIPNCKDTIRIGIRIQIKIQNDSS